jgi:hypothetical protein
MKTYKEPKWINNLDEVIAIAHKQSQVQVATVIDVFSGKAIFVILMLLSLPFCLPLQMPGLSTPFGLVIGFLSLRLIFKQHRHIPRWLLEKKIKSSLLIKIVSYVKKFFLFCKKFTRPRLAFLVTAPWIHKLHGLFLFMCALILSLPLPIPFTNFFVAVPILCICLGYLEEDGLLVMLGYGVVVLAVLVLVKMV